MHFTEPLRVQFVGHLDVFVARPGNLEGDRHVFGPERVPELSEPEHRVPTRGRLRGHHERDPGQQREALGESSRVGSGSAARALLVVIAKELEAILRALGEQ
jgi:hypothetical protein